MVTIKEALANASELLENAGVESPKADARILLETLLDISREDVLLKRDDEIADDKYQLFQVLVERRKKREPVSRILGYRDFWKSRFEISAETLDPRPDTEILIEQVVKYCSEIGLSNILDLGTGSGCILLSLLQEFEMANGVGLDVSADAVKTSTKNANNLNLNDRAKFLNLSWSDYKVDNKFDAVVSNPPYIEEDVIEELEDEVKKFDPMAALVAGSDGLDCYREIVSLLPNFLKKNGWVFLEIGYNQKYDVEEILSEGGFTVIETVKDLGGLDRCIIARWN